MGTRFQMDRNFEKELLSSTQVGEALQPITAEVAQQAKTNTRFRGIARGISAVVGRRGDGIFVGRVVGDDLKTGWAEFGTAKIPQERALGRALEQVVGPIQSQGGTDA